MEEAKKINKTFNYLTNSVMPQEFPVALLSQFELNGELDPAFKSLVLICVKATKVEEQEISWTACRFC